MNKEDRAEDNFYGAFTAVTHSYKKKDTDVVAMLCDVYRLHSMSLLSPDRRDAHFTQSGKGSFHDTVWGVDREFGSKTDPTLLEKYIQCFESASREKVRWDNIHRWLMTGVKVEGKIVSGLDKGVALHEEYMWAAAAANGRTSAGG
jgi:hypothetical protein